MKSFCLILMAMISVGCVSIRTVASDTGGANDGGGSFVRVNGNLVLSDSHYDFAREHVEGQVGNAFRYSELPRAVRDMVHNLIHAGETIRIFGIKDFYEQRIESDDNRYYFVTAEEFRSLNCSYLPPTRGAVQAHFQFGCTINSSTYLIRDQFIQADIRQQARAIVHERLWTLNRVEQAIIARFSNTLDKLLRMHEQQSAGNSSKMTVPELADAKRIYQAEELLGMGRLSPDYQREEINRRSTRASCENNNRILTAGGGMVICDRYARQQDIVIEDSSLIGVGSTLEIGPALNQRASIRVSNSLILNSRLFQYHQIFRENGLFLVELNNAKVVNSRLGSLGGIRIIGAEITDSSLTSNFGGILEVLNGAVLTNFRFLETQRRDGFNNIYNLRVGEGAKLRNVTLSFESANLRVVANSDISNLTYVSEEGPGWSWWRRDDYPMSTEMVFSGQRDFQGLNCQEDSGLTVNENFNCR